MKLNNEQAKHLAGTLRIVAVAQFAAFGWAAIQSSDWLGTLWPTTLFILLEFIALYALQEED